MLSRFFFWEGGIVNQKLRAMLLKVGGRREIRCTDIQRLSYCHRYTYNYNYYVRINSLYIKYKCIIKYTRRNSVNFRTCPFFAVDR